MGKERNKWITIWEKKGIRNRLLLSMSALVILSVGLCTLVLSMYWSSEKLRTFDQYSGEITRQISKSVSASLENLDRLAISIAYSNNIQRVLEVDYNEYPSLYAANSRAAGWYLMNTKNASSGIVSIYVYDLEGNLFSTPMGFRNFDYDFREEEWLEEFGASDAVSCVIGPRINGQETYPDDEMITVVRKVRSLETMEEAGYVVINVRMEDMLDNNLQRIWNADNGTLLIVTHENRIVFDPGELFSPKKSIDGDVFESLEESDGIFEYDHLGSKYHVVFECCDNGWYVMRVVENSNLYLSIRKMLFLSAVVAALIILVAFFPIYAFANGFVRPILRIQKSIQHLASNNFDFFAETMEEKKLPVVNCNNEIDLLIFSFNQMAVELYSNILTIHQTEQEKHKLEMEALFTQINPHFTYNTLNTIKQMAILQDAPGIADMTDAIVNLLRATAKYGDGTSSLEKELEILRDYIYIMQMRYYDNFECFIETNPDTQCAIIPCMILQPIVENAILHGIFGIDRPGEIQILSRIEEGILLIIVSDNGKGFDPNYVNALLSGVKSQEEGHDSVGIYNVHRRIQLRYGKEFGLQFEKGEPQGTVVTIRIPMEDGNV